MEFDNLRLPDSVHQLSNNCWIYYSLMYLFPFSSPWQKRQLLGFLKIDLSGDIKKIFLYLPVTIDFLLSY